MPNILGMGNPREIGSAAIGSIPVEVCALSPSWGRASERQQDEPMQEELVPPAPNPEVASKVPARLPVRGDLPASAVAQFAPKATDRGNLVVVPEPRNRSPIFCAGYLFAVFFLSV